jgi:enterochelin esterase-like enzyme
MPKKNVLTKQAVLKTITVDERFIYSEYLERKVRVDFYLPVSLKNYENVNLLLINDGQDLVKMNFGELLDELNNENKLEPMMCVGIHCGDDRMNEYGTICQPDYQGYGSKAGLYAKFIFDELMPFIRKSYHIISFKEKSFAGFSLGGLSAMDIVWNHASEFRKVGVFSGSLWWRRKAYDDGYEDEKDRIMHLQVRKGTFTPWLKFFFECGTLDETADRNNNGIIDAIDDLLDMIMELKIKGYTNEHIRYMELPEGKHDVETWKEAFPDFLKWGWGV